MCTDPRSYHPAIMAWRECVGKFPPLKEYDRVINTLGPEPQKVLLRAIWLEWLKQRYNPYNIIGILDCYKRGWVKK